MDKASENILLEDLMQKPVRSGSPMEIATLLLELYQSNDPFMQIFFIFTFVTLVIPFVGGVVIIAFNLLTEDKNKPRQASSYIPFCGVLVEFTTNPISFLRRQLYSKSDPLEVEKPLDNKLLFTLDMLVRETTCLYSRQAIKDWNTIPDVNHGHLVFLGGQINEFFHPGYKASLNFYLNQAKKVFNPSKSKNSNVKVDIFENNREGLNEYLAGRVQEMVESHSSFNLFSLSSFIYWHSLLYILLGPNFCKENNDLIDELQQCQEYTKFNFSRFMHSYGVPTGQGKYLSSIALKFQKAVDKEIQNRVDSPPYNDYLQILLDKKPTKNFNQFLWCHLAHLMFSHYAGFAASLSFTYYHLLLDPSLFKSLKQCLIETSRLYGPVMITRTITEKTKLAEYDIQRGNTVFISPTMVHLNEKVYNDPEEYLPKRWSNPKEVEKRVSNGDLVLYNGLCYGGIMSAFLDQLVINSVSVIDAHELALVEESQKLTLDYFQTLSAPQAKIMVKIESKKEK